MRRSYGISSAVAVALVLGGAVVQTSCFFVLDLEDCSRYPSTKCFDGGTGDGGPLPGCDPSKSATPVADSCGVFVSPSGADGNAGTKAKPLKTFKAALAKGSAIYACAGPTAFSEVVSIDKAVTLFGAVDCAKGWAYNASKKTQLTAKADTIPMALASTASGSEIHDFAITAADAMTAGGSSIALLDDHADIALENVDVVAGLGAAGAAGVAQAQVMTPASAKGNDGTDDAACVVTNVIAGGSGGTNICNGTTTNGGNGGKGIPDVNGGKGGDGQPMMIPGNGGSGQTGAASCNPGTKGSDGSTGMPGAGARGIGDVSSSGYQAPASVLGGIGNPGQGGGGGGGALACDMPTNMFAGPSGGGGGAGGCGGAPGNLGLSGGSSIGILALGAKLTLTTVTITTTDGGAGGKGGNGQQGGAGGQPGSAVGANACGGNKGGQGGAGGPGSGGAGGHSVAIAIKGGTLPDLSGTTITKGKGAVGGAGGDMDMTMQTRGDDGLACKTLDFTNPMSPSACGM